VTLCMPAVNLLPTSLWFTSRCRLGKHIVTIPAAGLVMHATANAEYKVKGALPSYVVIIQSFTILELIAIENKSLLVWGNIFHLSNHLFNVVD